MSYFTASQAEKELSWIEIACEIGKLLQTRQNAWDKSQVTQMNTQLQQLERENQELKFKLKL